MTDLVERVARAIYDEDPETELDFKPVPYDEAAVRWRKEAQAMARAAIAEVRRFDVERGPSDAEIAIATDEYWRISRGPDVNDMKAALKAAARVRLEGVEG